jgi:hypothetical protein
MKEIKLIHIIIAVILVLLSVAIVQWTTFPKSGPPPATQLPGETGQPEELPVLPQNELYNSSAAPSFAKDLPPFEETRGQDILEPKDPAMSSGKAEL